MRFDRETFVKLYRQESPQHRLKGLFSRTFRDFLLRFAEDDGTLLRSTKDAVGDLCKVTSADQAERKLVKQAVDDLIELEFLTLTRGRLFITRFEEAQEARSPGAKRQAEYKKRQRTASPGDVTKEDSTASSETSPGDVIADGQEKRGEEKRSPPSPPGAESDGLVPCPSELLSADVVEEMAAVLTVDPSVVRDGEREFKTYWTIGKGAGRRFSRGMWIAKCRERIRQRFEAGELRLRREKTEAAEETWDQ